jgi:hypothetical protein
MTAKPDFMAQLIDVLRERMPNAGDQITRRVLRLFLRTGWTFENYVGPLVDLEQRGWIKSSGETYTTTAEVRVHSADVASCPHIVAYGQALLVDLARLSPTPRRAIMSAAPARRDTRQLALQRLDSFLLISSRTIV